MGQYTKTKQAPVGMFDSGVGGLSVWREVVKLLPKESIVYYADSGNCPYGPKSQEEVIKLSDTVVQFLMAKGCKIIVIACNTATSSAIDYLRDTYPEMTFVGMEPAIKPAALSSKTGVIGILATAGTLKGRLFNETKARFASNVEVLMQVGDGLVELVEKGRTHTPEAQALLKRYIDPMLEKHADNLVLGCTHYPFLSDDIDAISGGKIHLIDPAPAVAQHLFHLLEEQHLLNDSRQHYYHFYSSNGIEVLKSMIEGLGLTGNDYQLEEV